MKCTVFFMKIVSLKEDFSAHYKYDERDLDFFSLMLHKCLYNIGSSNLFAVITYGVKINLKEDTNTQFCSKCSTIAFLHTYFHCSSFGQTVNAEHC